MSIDFNSVLIVSGKAAIREDKDGAGGSGVSKIGGSSSMPSGTKMELPTIQKSFLLSRPYLKANLAPLKFNGARYCFIYSPIYMAIKLTLSPLAETFNAPPLFCQTNASM